MRKFLACLIVAGAIFGLCCKVHSGSLPPGPIPANPDNPAVDNIGKAQRLFELTRSENSGLQWSECLSEKAYVRARKMATDKQFGHKDPATGVNPAWEMMGSCGKWISGAENLAKGHVPPETLHKALMQSPSHRQSIQNSNYNHLGVGCYDNICVELFASR